jgi:hypothetical protein
MGPRLPSSPGRSARPANLVDALAALHARYHGAADLPAAIPRVTHAWWQALCREWVDLRLREYAARHPPETTARARALIGRAAGHPAASAVLAGLPPDAPARRGPPRQRTGARRPGHAHRLGQQPRRPGSARLANLVPAGSADIARYARAWQRLTGQPLPAATIELGYRWATLQIPVQYLPWTTGHRPTRDVEAALDQIERALGRLRSLAVRDGSCRDRG